jgi:hypothetical protein
LEVKHRALSTTQIQELIEHDEEDLAAELANERAWKRARTM